MSGTRSFVAIELPRHVSAELILVGETIRQGAPEWRGDKWVPERNLHITLSFLGNLDASQLCAIRNELGSALRTQEPFEMALLDVRGASLHRRQSMLWATFSDGEGRCARLAETIHAAALRCGIAQSDRRFSPHVTLVRARRARSLAPDALTAANAVLTTRGISMSVLSATLFASTLARGGPVYERLDTWPFVQRT